MIENFRGKLFYEGFISLDVMEVGSVREMLRVLGREGGGEVGRG